jgi:hypothetical protein
MHREGEIGITVRWKCRLFGPENQGDSCITHHGGFLILTDFVGLSRHCNQDMTTKNMKRAYKKTAGQAVFRNCSSLTSPSNMENVARKEDLDVQ